MAGEIEEPFRLNCQADLLRSGSISFGRFESEPLSWERRSIFSHNRYLEEVEKYSKPGSVTEKKAFFEAHFRRKALLKQSSSECQDGVEFLTSKNEDLHDLEESDDGNENRQFTYFGESPCSSDPLGYNKETKIQQHEKEDIETLYVENGDESRHVACFDEMPHSSGPSRYGEDTIIQESERRNCQFFSISPEDEHVINMVDCPISSPEHVKLDETHQSETENLVVNTEESNGVTLIDKVGTVGVASEANDSNLTCHTAEKDEDSASSGPHRMFSPKVRPASEKKLTRPKLKTQANVDRFQKNISNEASKGSMKPRISENESLPVKKTEKRSPRPASPFTRSGVETSKAEDAFTSLPKEKILHPKKSIVKDLRSEKAVEAQSTILEKSLPRVHQTASRPKQTIGSSKAHIIESAAGFSLKTDQRAANRKEEKQAAEMKQFRKSLIFKATPMPSFYYESAHGSDQHKVTPTSKTPKQPQTPSHPVAAHINKKVAFNPSVPSATRPSSSTSSTNRIRTSEAVRRNHVPEKKEQEKKKDPSLKKQKEPEPRARDLSKKDMKDVHMGRCSKSGYLAVGVAS